MRRSVVFLAILLLFVLSPPAQAQEADTTGFQDALLDQLVGNWTMTGHVMGDSVRYDAEAQWVLGHQFLRLRMTDVNTPPEYAAHIYIGYDPSKDAYVAHWLDTAGGQPSTTLGYGHREGDAVMFRFEYPDGPFRTTFEQDPDGTWHVRMRSKSEAGEWQPFAVYVLRRSDDP